jgi:heme/copper-type cytochrome/quinol oxidase subunit 2
MLAVFLELLASGKPAAEEGRDIILSMLVVGLIFLAVVAVGDFFLWRMRKRHNTQG